MPVNVNRSGIVQVSQPVRKMQKKKTLWILVVIAAVASLVVWRLVAPRSASQQRLTVEGVRKQLEKVTPVGSSRSAVAGYLDSQSIQHSYIEDSKFPNERGKEVDRRWEEGDDLDAIRQRPIEYQAIRGKTGDATAIPGGALSRLVKVSTLREYERAIRQFTSTTGRRKISHL